MEMVCLGGVSLKNHANQLKLFNQVSFGISRGLTGDLMGAKAFVEVDVIATEMTQSQINCRHYFL